MLGSSLNGRVPASHANGCGFESILRFCFDENILKEVVVNYINYIEFRALGLILDETNMSPMFLLRLYDVIMASGNTSGNFSCRFEKWFVNTFMPLLLSLNRGQQIGLLGSLDISLLRYLNRTICKF